MIIQDIMYSTIGNKCPRCHKGKVFENRNPYSFKNGLTMKNSCSECHLKYEREPGFFYGALYVSYALMSGLFIVWFLADLLWFHMEALTLAIFVLVTMLALFPVVFRSARIIWMNFFFRHDKKYSNETKNERTLHENNFEKNKITFQ